MKDLQSRLYDLLCSIEELEPEIQRIMKRKNTFKNITLKSNLAFLNANLDSIKRQALNIITKENKDGM